MRRALFPLIGVLCLAWTAPAAKAQDEARANLALGPDKTVTHERIGWYVDRTADAQKRATELGQPLVLVLSPARCEDCRALEHDVLACPAINRFAGHAVFALANPSRDQLARSLMGALKIATYPAVLLLDPKRLDAEPRVQIEGYVPAGNLSLYLRERLAIADPTLPSLDDGVAVWRSSSRGRLEAPQDCAVDPDGLLPGLAEDGLVTADQATTLDEADAIDTPGADCTTRIDEYDDLAVDCASTWPKWAAAAVPVPAAHNGPAISQSELGATAGAALYAVFGYDDEVEYGRGDGRYLGLAVGIGPRTLAATCHALGNHGLIAIRSGAAGSGGSMEVKVSAADATGDRCWLSLEASEKPLDQGGWITGARATASLGAAESMVAASLLQGSEFASYQVRLERLGESSTFTVPNADVVLDTASAGAVLFDRRGNLVGFIPVAVKGELRPNLVLPAERFWQP